MPKLLRVGRQWFRHTGEDWVDLVYEGDRMTQIRPEALPAVLYRFLQAHQFEWGPEDSGDCSGMPRDLWDALEQKYAPLAKALDEANRGFCSGDDPGIDIPVVLDNIALFELYGLAKERGACF